MKTLNTTTAATADYINPVFVVSTISKYKLYKQLDVQQCLCKYNPLDYPEVLSKRVHIVSVREVTTAILDEIKSPAQRFEAVDRMDKGLYLEEYIISDLSAEEVVAEAVRAIMIEDNRLYEIECARNEAIQIEREYRADMYDIEDLKATCYTIEKVRNKLVRLEAPSDMVNYVNDLRVEIALDLVRRVYK